MPEQKSPILGGFSEQRSPDAADNQIVNLFSEIIETKDGKVPGYLLMAPGLDLLDTVGPGPIRGLEILGSLLYVVSGNEVWTVTNSFVNTKIGQVAQGTGPVAMIQNTLQLMIFDGIGAWLAPGGFPLTGGAIGNPGVGYAVGDIIVFQSATGTINASASIRVTAVANATPFTAIASANAGAGSVITFNATPLTIAIGDLAFDNTTTAAIPLNTTVTAFTPTTVTLSNNIVAPGVFAGDTIEFAAFQGEVTAFAINQGGAISAPTAQFTQKETSGNGAGFILAAPTFGAAVGLVPITLPLTNNPADATVLDGYGIVIEQGTQRIWQSDQLDLSTWRGLSFGVSNESPDDCTACFAIHDELYIFKQTATEIWTDNGTFPFAFGPLSGVHVEYGCFAPFSIAKVGEALIWIGRNAAGTSIAIEMTAYQPKVVSTQALANRWQSYPSTSDAIGYCYQQGGHVFYVVTFPTGGETWVYDATASAMAGVPLWHQRAAFNNGSFERHWGNAFISWIGSGNVSTTTSGYQPKAVTITAPSELLTATSLNGLQATFPFGMFSVWLLIPDSSATGIIFSNQTDDTHGTTNPGLFIEVQNDATGTPQITVAAWDTTNAPIWSATYDFAGWTGWVNLMISFSTPAQQLQVYANRVVGGTLIESKLTPVSIVWHSGAPVANPAGQPWHLAVVT